MAPLKRGHPVLENTDTDQENIDPEGSARTSAGAHQARKRVRVSAENSEDIRQVAQNDDNSSSSSEDEDDEDGDYNSPPQTQYELMRDDGFKHLENPEWDDWQAVQKLQQRQVQYGQNAPAEGGIIESITCVNFMCHERLHVELGPLINFIVGENGSGKSAVLTALTLCLGGKASDTNRGGSLKTFVKEGRDHGFLRVKIKNAGTDAYSPDIYGQSIIVERHFSKSGSSGFKILNDRQKIVSTKKQEIDEISEWYALQIGNPLTILSQDNARQFLNSASPAQKYKYFISGVQLEQLDNDYKMSQDTLERTLALREDLNEKIALVRKEKDEAERLAETVRGNEGLRAQSRYYRNQLVWCQVRDQERGLEDHNTDLTRRDENIKELENDCEAMTRALSEVEEKLSRAKDTREGLDSGKELLSGRISAAEDSFKASKRELQDVIVDERDSHLRLKNARQDIQSCEAKIAREERRLRDSTGSARAEKEAKREQASNEAQDLDDKIDQFNQQLPDLQKEVGEVDQKLAQQKKIIEGKKKAILETERGIKDLEKSTGSKYAGYEPDMISLVKEVARDSGFESKPLGPIGAHIKLLKPEWSSLMEKTLGEALNAFVVRSKRDQSRLSALIRKKNMRRSPPVYIAYGGRFDTRNQEPDAKFDTILRILEFDDDILRSQLIINSQIEKVILVKERVEAERVMVDDGPPKNVAACICFHDGKGKRGQGLRLTNRNGTIGTSPIVPGYQNPRMQADSGSQLAVSKENLKLLGSEMRELKSEENKTAERLRSCKNQVERHRESIKRFEVDLRHKQADIQTILTELDAFEGDDNLLEDLRAELDSKKAIVEQIGAQYGAISVQKSDSNNMVRQKREALEAVQREAETHEEAIIKADGKVLSHENFRRIAVSKKNEAYERVEIARDERGRAEVRRDRKAMEVVDFVQQATEVAPNRVHIGDDEKYDTIESKYEKIKKQLLERERRQGATDEQINDRAIEAAKRFEDVTRQTEDVDATIRALRDAIVSRLFLWRHFQRQISARIRTQFNYLLSERGFRGRIDLKHKEKKIDIQIEPDETKKSAAGRNTKTLSGGEKSFSSICMLLSIWEAISSPIRCLDEFDVFMDNVNRAISTKMLVDAARRSVSRQYILITPNAIEGRAELGKDVKIIRLTDPRQRRLD